MNAQHDKHVTTQKGNLAISNVDGQFARSTNDYVMNYAF